MLYYHVGKDDLYLAVLEAAYEKIRAEGADWISNTSLRRKAIRRLIDFTWNYFIRNPNFWRCSAPKTGAGADHEALDQGEV
jgi:AcrR family transcriptional regulator